MPMSLRLGKYLVSKRLFFKIDLKLFLVDLLEVQLSSCTHRETLTSFTQEGAATSQPQPRVCVWA